MAWTFYNSSGEALVQHAESEATQAEMEAETAGAKFVPPDLVKHAPGVAKAWCVRARAGSLNSGDYNVASITDTGTGDSIIVIATDFADTNYAVVASEMDSIDNIVDPHISNIAAGQFQLEIRNTSNSATDAAFGIACFGDQ